ncbi:DedA family protein [Campylobacter mucosalis]|uniref:Putative membrane protein, DedA family, type III (SNARE domain) n=1 Tax=Campylobacter mucosalis CCUG 21559 TaxID=1032067 RepID=A0A6G5QHK7_9BACT|nr:DedA family protein [Campylobacter mucosalis]KEA46423.1 membrane protein [Campylobacter mucosalis]QCD45175.1 putative membrane protein, DedA family, type III (SNARE domain) [Campylobacter mucosalis CCUG 21559]QKF63090.1 DedA family membrane protein, type III (SNARE domain) [Campylobacter mucosalis]
MQDMLNSLSTYGYIVLFLYTLGGGMVAIIAAGVLSYMGKMDISLSIAIAAISNAIGDTLLFYMGRYNKDFIMPLIKKQRRKLAYSHILMKKNGDIIIFLQKYVYGLKTLVPIAIGLTKYPFKKFTILNIVSSVVWAVAIGLASFFAGSLLMSIGDYVGDRSYIMPIFMIMLLGGIWLFLQKITKKNSRARK